MTSDTDAARRLLARHNPAPPDEFRDAPLDDRAEAALQDLLTTSRVPADQPTLPSRRPVRRVPALTAGLVALIVAAVTGVAGTIGIPGIGSGGSAYATTPDPLLLPDGPGKPAGPALERLAEVAADQPEPDLDGRYRYTKIRAWYLHGTSSSEGTYSELEPNLVENWSAHDGSGRSIEIDEDGRSEQTYSPGEGAPLFDAGKLSTDPEALTRQLLARDEPSGQPDNPEIPDDIEFVRSLQTLLHHQGVVRPELQAALWEALSTKGLTNYGTVTDRGGRDGIAFALDDHYEHGHTRYLLVVDPDTGRPLSSEEVAITGSEVLNVRFPAVLSYEVYLEAGTVDSTHQRPTSG